LADSREQEGQHQNGPQHGGKRGSSAMPPIMSRLLQELHRAFVTLEVQIKATTVRFHSKKLKSEEIMGG
jgi:hypothetical protein